MSEELLTKTNEEVTNDAQVNDETQDGNEEKVVVEQDEEVVDDEQKEKDVIKKTTEDSKDDKSILKKTETKPDYKELKLSDDSRLDKKDLNSLLKLAEKEGLTADQAKSTLEYAEKLANGQIERAIVQSKKEQDNWLAEVSKDEELGGENLENTTVLAQKALDELVPDKLQEIIFEAGFHNHPEFLRFLKSLGTMVSDDSFVGSKGTSQQRTGLASYGPYQPMLKILGF